MQSARSVWWFGRWNLIGIAALVFLLFCAGYPRISAAAEALELQVLTWSEYLDPDVIAEFEQRFGVRLSFTFFETDETRDDIMIAADGRGFDLILASALSSHTYQRRGWLAPITAADVPNLRHIDPQWLNHEAGVPGYGVPYFWGTLGIAWREDLVEAPVTRWMQLYEPTPDLQGRIVMIRHSRDLIGMALMALGYSANSGDTAELAAARKLLLGQRPHVKTYGYVALTEDSALVKGEVVAAQVYSGDGLMLRELDPRIRYVVPEEGTNIWIDYWHLAADSDNRKLAFAFLDFINEPEIAARIAGYLQYPTPNRAAEKLMPAEYLEDPLINPGADVLDRGEFHTLLPPRQMRRWNALFAEIVN